MGKRCASLFPANESPRRQRYLVSHSAVKPFYIPPQPTSCGLRAGHLCQVETIVGADIAALKAFIKRQTLHPLLRALSGERVVGGLVAAYLLWSYKETRSSTIGFA
eukprot:scaffold13039_cov36-Tisochrysis_lutea.AAC.1